MKGLWRGRRDGESNRVGEKINPILLFSLFFLSHFTSFQAASLLVRRKVWRGNESAEGEGGEGGGEGDEDEREKGR